MRRCATTDLTKMVSEPENRPALAEGEGVGMVQEVSEAGFVAPSRLPEGWVPEGAGVWVVARHDPDAMRWEALAPEFNIAGLGDSVSGALKNVCELLDDYLLLAAEEGKRFEETYRPISMRWKFGILREVLAAVARSKRHHSGSDSGPDSPDHSYLRLPITAH
jgi:hypothetical protein